MANKIMKKKIQFSILIFSVLALIFSSNCKLAYAKKITTNEKEKLTNLSHLNLTKDDASNLKFVKQLIKSKIPKGIYIEQWILDKPGNTKLIGKLHKLTKKNNIKLYLVVGRNSWFGKRGVLYTLDFLTKYEKDIDGIVLRVEPNKVNVWKDDIAIQAQVLNQMLNAYSAIYQETKKKKKIFIAEFPFWLSDFQGTLKSFSQNVCDYTDKIIFLIDNLEKLDNLDIKWNDVPCMYNINITKRATNQSEELTHDTYNKLKEKLVLYSNFNGYLIDSNSSISE